MNTAMNKYFFTLFTFLFFISSGNSFTLSFIKMKDIKEVQDVVDVTEKRQTLTKGWTKDTMEGRFLLWKKFVVQSGSSLKTIKAHFPELFSIVEEVYNSKTINDESYESLSNFMKETIRFFRQTDEDTPLEFSKRSKEQSRFLIYKLLDESPIQVLKDYEMNDKMVDKIKIAFEKLGGIIVTIVIIGGVVLVVTVSGIIALYLKK